MEGTITFNVFGYGFGNAVIQTAPDAPPTPGKILRFLAAEGLEVLIPFVTAEQWAEFQLKVAEEDMPSAIALPNAGDVRHVNGSKLH